MIFAIVLVSISFFIANALAKEYGEDKGKTEDIFFILLISGFIGARLSYALMNFNLYRENMFSIFKISHYNLSLIGGVIIGLLTLIILSGKKIEFQKLLKIFVMPFYFSMSIGIWVVMFDKFLLPFNISNNPIKILYLSIIFLLGIILELVLSKKTEHKYITLTILCITMFLYYIV